MKFGRRQWPSPNTRSATGTPRAPMSIRRARAAFWFGSAVFALPPFHGHQCSASAWPSSVPSPVIATPSSSNA
jgi:hypothetical protein